MRADRLLTIMLLLQSEGRLTAKELAKRLEVSERTIYRDMDALCTAGVPIHAHPGTDGGFFLPRDYRIRLDGLTRPEIHALFLHQPNQLAQQLGIGDALRSALLKLLHALPAPVRGDADWIRDRIFLDSDSWRPSAENVRFLQTAQQAIWEERCVNMTYVSRQGNVAELEMKPYGLIAKGGIWFLAGESGGQVRAFRLARVRSLDITGEPFRRPDGFSLQAFWREWVTHWEEKRARFSAVLDLSAEGVALLAKGSVLPGGTTPASQPSLARKDWVRITLPFENEEAALACLFALGIHAVVVEPAALASRLQAQAEQLAQFYRTGTGESG
ncbi:helix-turn-helix transcriptional regulator [Brevibacillus sp. GCM10020057]|uniref:helix-turn-helix transcriptional regulator n=1 Tax=Brevibacillus sp. GCM10020057 TaxID=3317327 RepID=UPI00362BB56F